MARYLFLLDATQRRAFDQPPVFNPPQRQLFFALPDWATRSLATLLAPHSRGGFVLQVGYFKTTGCFFPVDRFLATDQAYVQQRYHLGAVEWTRYGKVTRFNHQQQILQQFGVPPFEQVEAAVRQQVTHFARLLGPPFSVSIQALSCLLWLKSFSPMLTRRPVDPLKRPSWRPGQRGGGGFRYL
ncbi:DUF4158 domain-containing protein (plasmid) [Hymenobacter aerilatus]|jgi:hypothetical protein|uniref:DUF4158 domain-containing protein n=7 Tax=Hymenobacter TaxID=89966 RepID=A0A3R9NZV0_9BACT|nr:MULTISPECIES: DUF4158 domain-containing protein [Hymenobacter]AIZ65623.1 hypothetical protein PK28_18660 [Hymenobacter sp. DG25B]MBF9223396.1 DUF4158 domain-containing protein [Hymenobacter ruricola]MBO3269156.1 DUF4158 domain-containing protein [Hymenobacter defluvii]MDF7815603.1 DUF4158 domain-containing protein [Hymenobacter sp. YC55]QNE42075.1 DUF4158 domain-containing protein [Hymenobacter sp. NBH84]